MYPPFLFGESDFFCNYSTPYDYNNDSIRKLDEKSSKIKHDDGTYQPNFRPIHTGVTAAEYATAVANELYWALGGLVEEE